MVTPTLQGAVDFLPGFIRVRHVFKCLRGQYKIEVVLRVCQTLQVLASDAVMYFARLGIREPLRIEEIWMLFEVLVQGSTSINFCNP